MMACRGYQTCTSPTCSDTPAICGHPDGPYPNGNRPKYCSVQSTVTFFCTENKPASLTRGWCCRGGEVCGREYGDCTCRGELCGEHLCCGEGEACETNFFGSRTECVFRCPRGQTQCGSDCCKAPLVCTPNGCDCPSGTVQRGVGRCVAPKEDPGPPGWNPFRDMANMMGASSSSHGGGHRRRSVFARAAQSGSPAIDAALTALAATRGQAASAALAFRAGRDDPAFRRRVTVARVRPPTVSAGPGLDAASAAAITQLLAAEAKAYALAAASAKALWRARAAKAAHQRVFARRQLRASAAFAGRAATALQRVPALRAAAANALTAGGVAEVTPTEDQATAFVASVKSSGIPPYLKTPLTALGVGSADVTRLRAGMLGVTVTSASGPSLIAPLNDPDQAAELKRLISSLSKYSKRARRHRIAR
jgi:hypothetical protein